MAKWGDCFDDKETLDQGQPRSTTRAQASASPARRRFFINGRMLVGAQPFEQFKNMISTTTLRLGASEFSQEGSRPGRRAPSAERR